MKVIIAGSRTITDYNFVKECIVDSIKKLEWWNNGIRFGIVSGGAYGVDKLGEQYAKENDIGLSVLEAQWYMYGKKAGYVRNWAMADMSNALIAIWDGKSKGTKHMIDIANKKGLKVFVYKVENEK
ncbi:hypothetical protein LCGC14_2100100 [marine sediment metagenome]|uniref:DUF2493 domain-containing protein n=1 Tax=marine sediment metagenome TaxID=412755 RepID=A0A0F9H6N4_9ZZZZ